MSHDRTRCPRCGYSSSGPSRPDLRAGSPCPQCSAPMESIAAPPAVDLRKDFAKARGIEDRPRIPKGGAPGAVAGFGTLAGRAIAAFRERGAALVLLGLVAGFLPAVATVPFAALLGSRALASMGPVAEGLALVLAALAAVYGAGWGASLLATATASPPRPAAETVREGGLRANAVAGALLLCCILVAGGTLLFVIPGLLFALWFVFTPWAVLEGHRGLDALLRSRELVRGHERAVLARLLALAVIGGIIGRLLPPAQLLYGPFVALFLFAMFEDLRQGERRTASLQASGGKGGLVATAALGFALPLLFLALFGGSLPRMQAWTRDAVEAIEHGEQLPPLPLPRSMGRRPPSGPPAPPGPAGGFEELLGTWSGPPDGGGGTWRFRFAAPAEVEADGPGGEAIRGSARVFWDRAAEGGLRVLPGGYPLDLVADDGAGELKIILGTFRRRGGELQLCLGRPGGEVRTSHFATTADVTCWRLAPSAP